MIRFKNGHCMDFACASGALAFKGDGWWWEQPARWLGLLQPHEFTIITKTLTYNETKGNLRWWCPWRCVRLIQNGAVNAIGLTNPGYSWWINRCYPHIIKRKYKVIVSIYPKTVLETIDMIQDLNRCDGIVGIEINLSCPNVSHYAIESQIKIVETALEVSHHPLGIKLGYQDPYIDICKALDNKGLAFIELINTVPYKMVFPDKISPLAKYGLEGGVSGKPIIPFARKALTQAILLGIKTPIASGGGISSPEEVYARRLMGAKAYVIGVGFLRHITQPNKIVKTCRSVW